jgi:hypothetical protein
LSARPALAVVILVSFVHHAKVRRRWREQEIPTRSWALISDQWNAAETYPTIAEAMTAAALKLLDMTDRLEALDRSGQPVGTSIG